MLPLSLNDTERRHGSLVACHGSVCNLSVRGFRALAQALGLHRNAQDVRETCLLCLSDLIPAIDVPDDTDYLG